MNYYVSKTLYESFNARLGDFMTDCFQGQVQGNSEENEIKVLKVKNFDTMGNIDFSDTTYTSHKMVNTRKLLIKGDIITPFRGQAILTNKFAFFISDETSTIDNNVGVIRVDDAKVLPKYLYYFLKSKYGFEQIIKQVGGSTIPVLTREKISSVKFPLLDKVIQEELVKTLDQAERQKKEKEAEAERLLASIDDYVLSELGITLPEIRPQKCFAVMASEIEEKRIDSQYYLSKNTVLEFALKKSKFSPVKIASSYAFLSGYAFSSNDYVDKSETKLLTIKNITKSGLQIDDVTYLPDNYYKNYERFVLKQGDLVFAMTGATIGKSCIFNAEDNFLLNQRVGAIRGTGSSNIYFLYSLLNTTPYRNEIVRKSVGGAQPNISEKYITDLEIPFPPLNIQKRIATEVQSRMEQAQALKREAAEGLEKAKKQVEAIILAK